MRLFSGQAIEYAQMTRRIGSSRRRKFCRFFYSMRCECALWPGSLLAKNFGVRAAPNAFGVGHGLKRATLEPKMRACSSAVRAAPNAFGVGHGLKRATLEPKMRACSSAVRAAPNAFGVGHGLKRATLEPNMRACSSAVRAGDS